MMADMMMAHLLDSRADTESIRLQRVETIHALLGGYSSLSVPQLLKPLSLDFTHHVLPASLGMPVRDRESFSQHAQTIFSIFSAFKMIPDAIYDDDAQGVVVIHSRMEGITKQGSQRWTNECVMMVRLSQDGREVVSIQEFVDSAKAIEMKAKFAPRNFTSETTTSTPAKMERRVSGTLVFT
ncbi:hypothetical protein OQA88_2447 [Cercophora sp. LCS_1]